MSSTGWIVAAAATVNSYSYKVVGELELGLICAGLLIISANCLSVGDIILFIQFFFLCLLRLELYTLHSPTFHVLHVCTTFSSYLTTNKHNSC
jgi:hypothetical protein